MLRHLRSLHFHFFGQILQDYFVTCYQRMLHRQHAVSPFIRTIPSSFSPFDLDPYILKFHHFSNFHSQQSTTIIPKMEIKILFVIPLSFHHNQKRIHAFPQIGDSFQIPTPSVSICHILRVSIKSNIF